ncbi:alpha/beta fold hydrolase [Streptomyces sp. PTM05]|uniref:Alpha/beta fold hydrolase n=1 Tax=Streptantibioticus parmotrematis TaxID=2873249 RepID=A0ABS7QUW0_9ACTN|nr:type I polyketide synthase [Streptantibioticus parmotrematis]MBY8887001.1 alpha/beta fold hydrolase [Streptantibioticus parmotrematis]
MITVRDYLSNFAAPSDQHGRTLPEVFESARETFGAAPAVLGSGEPRNWSHWRGESRALAAGLRDLGIDTGDVVAVHLPNCWEFLVAHVAVAEIGAVLMPLHLAYQERDLLALIQRARARLLILPAARRAVDGELLSDRLRFKASSLDHVLTVGGPGSPSPGPGPGADEGTFASLVEGHRDARLQEAALAPDAPFVLLPSSGTVSGQPKLCMHDHGALLANAAQVALEGGTGKGDTMMSASPFTHLFGLLSVHLSLLTGSRQALLPRWDAELCRDLMVRTGASVLFAVPAQLRDLTRELDYEPKPGRLGLREVRTGGAPVSGSLVTDVRRLTGAATVVQWGMSELGAGMVTRADDPPEVAVGSVGRPLTGSSARVVDDDGRVRCDGHPGELQYRGPHLFRGYLGQPDLTRAAFTPDGWLRTGDLATRNPDGTFSLRGRTAEVINVGGVKFSAPEVEGLLDDMPQLAAAALVGRPDARLGQYPCLIAATRSGAVLDLATVRAHLQAKGVSGYMLPVELVLVDEVPFTPSGKVARGRLLELLELLERNTSHALPQDGSWRERVIAEPAAQRHLTALALIRDKLTAILHVKQEAAAGRRFRELGLDSMGAVRLAIELSATTGLPLPTTAVFDHPTPEALGRHLVELAMGSCTSRPITADRPAEAVVAAGPGDDDPVVVVGMGCRLPGGVHSPQDLWRLLDEGRETVGPLPTDRGWDIDALVHPDPSRPGRSVTRLGHFLAEAAGFDARFFGIPPREALAMDPQQRLLLETTWEALEQAGIDPTSLRDSDTGVFIGQMASDYAPRLTEAPAAYDGLLMTGNAGSVASGRISYTLGLTGPALTVDTACSSSLVALHLAVQALRRGECSLAVAGGATIMGTAAPFVDFSRLGVLAPDGRCKAFASEADGAAWGEGVGVLILGRLSDTRRYGRPVLAIVAGSAVNQDGASNGLTAPNGIAQQQVLRRALADAHVTARQVDVIEAHGTGTPLGDQIEAEALRSVYGADRDVEWPVWLGSLKSNIGHTQAAAGIAGVIKTVLALQNEMLPASLHTGRPRAPVTADPPGPLRLLTRARPWPRSDRSRYAAVSAFGISGTNGHVILREPPAAPPVPPTPTRPDSAVGGPVPWVFSARSASALRALAAKLVTRVGRADPREVGRALTTSRSRFEHRAVVVAPDEPGLRAGLDAVAKGVVSDDAVVGTALPTGKVVFVFPGQGAQWAGMAGELLSDSEVFARSIAATEQALAPHVDFSVTAVLRGAPGHPSLQRVEVAQCSLFAVMVALAEVWRSLGLCPDAVVGHSQGEIAAAHVSGALSLQDAVLVVARRALAVRELAGGRMAAVALSRDELSPHLARFESRLSLAVENGPSSTVVSGAAEAVSELVAELRGRGVYTKPLDVDYASHCASVSGIKKRLLRDFDGIRPGAAKIPFFSTVVAGQLDSQELTARYWYRNLRRPVEFHRTVHALMEFGHTAFIEISPHPALVQHIQEAADTAGRSVTAVGTLRRGEGGRRRLLLSAAEAYTSGVPVAWQESFAGLPSRHVELPCYPFQHKHYWLPGGPASGSEAGPPVTETPVKPASVPRTVEGLLVLVLAHTARVLGHGDVTGIDADAAFLTLGTASLAATELRTRLARTLGMPLSATVVLDQGTPRALASHLWRLLQERTGTHEQLPSSSRDRSATQPTLPEACLPLPRSPGLPDTLSALYQHACRTGHGEAALDLVSAAARLRPTFTADAACEHASEPVRLGTVETGPALIFFPSLLPAAGPHEYVRLARSLHDSCQVLALPHPGFPVGSSLPRGLDALVAAHTTVLDRFMSSGPLLLCGHSSGGLVAHAVAAHLEELGRPANGVVLLDSYWPDDFLWTQLLPRLLSSAAALGQPLTTSGLSTERLTASGGYLQLFTGWQPGPIRTPTLLLRAREPVPEVPTDWQSRPWKLPHRQLSIPGNHFTMLTDHVTVPAEMIRRWYGTGTDGAPDQPGAGRRPAGMPPETRTDLWTEE